MRENLSDTREAVEAESHYLYFDEAIDRYHRGECSFEEAIASYRVHVGAMALRAVTQRPPEPR